MKAVLRIVALILSGFLFFMAAAAFLLEFPDYMSKSTTFVFVFVFVFVGVYFALYGVTGRSSLSGK
ncbi:hypothetical protein [Alcanivorax quisquiliarum]|uniref:Uncharacterized protein n=1 Tax=Alcanivorax quisquiliarum TaxID=2933565 RepID=A0ABT0E4U1_9GAMM|nr:hypothetical protein [Alcanivorax quisquiliarum]MCK0536839.1 hypothetical protein [Alcanivorax quisquiliarum]